MPSKGLTNRSYADRSLAENGVWERASFTVPLPTSEEKVQWHAGTYQNRFGKHLERQGFTVLKMTPPSRITNEPVDDDRKKYAIYAWVRRRPSTFTLEVPDEKVLAMMSLGMKLNE